MPKRRPVMLMHRLVMPKRRPVILIHRLVMPKRRPVILIHRLVMPKRRPVILMHRPAIELYRVTMRKRISVASRREAACRRHRTSTQTMSDRASSLSILF
jgi:hypothetical protein